MNIILTDFLIMLKVWFGYWCGVILATTLFVPSAMPILLIPSVAVWLIMACIFPLTSNSERDD